MEIYDEYLLKHYESDIGSMLATDVTEGPMRLHLDMCHLQREVPELFGRIVKDAWEERRKWNASLLRVQDKILSNDVFLVDSGELRDSCYVTLYNLPMLPDTHFFNEYPGHSQKGRLIQIKGNVIRLTKSTMIESQRQYICSKCKKTVWCQADYSRTFTFAPPTKCPDARGPNMCKGAMQPKKSEGETLIEFQEMRLQQISSESRIPRTIIVTMEGDLVDSCGVGDCVVVCGGLQTQSVWTKEHQRCTVHLVLRAVSVYSDQRKLSRNFADEAMYAHLAWQETVESEGEAKAREKIVSSFSPRTRGMQCIKLALCIVLSSGDRTNLRSTNSYKTRQNSHILLIGDPALSKSKLIIFASEIAARSVFTTGVGSTRAGLTAAAIRENNEWILEAGAMVLSDNGVCVIDEFHQLTNHDKASIHECLEQQTLSIAKAGLVCTRRTRCSAIAAMNPKEHPRGQSEEEIEVDSTGLSSPLLSRFDLIFRLMDEYDRDWDEVISTHILSQFGNGQEADLEDDQLWDKRKLQAHFLMVKDISPVLLEPTKRVLKEYYLRCRQTYPNVLRGRTTYRLFNSLERLAKAHAKLMARTEVSLVDATAIIYLMETSWGYGGILPTINVMTDEMPYPTEEMIDQMLYALSLTRDDIGGNDLQPPSQTSCQVVENGYSAESNKRRHPEDDSPQTQRTKRIPITADSLSNSPQLFSLTSNFRHDFLENSSQEGQEGLTRPPDPAFVNFLSDKSLNLDLDDTEDIPQNQETSIRSVEQSSNFNAEETKFPTDEAQAGSSNTSLNVCQLNLEELRRDLQCFQHRGDNSNGENSTSTSSVFKDPFKDFDYENLELD